MRVSPAQPDAAGPRSRQQDPIRLRQCPMRLADLLLGVVGIDEIRLGGEGIARARGQDDVVGEDLLARRRDHPVRIDHDGTVPDHPAVGEQPIVGQEDSREPGGIHERPKSGDIVHEGVLRLDEHDVARLVQCFGHGDTAVAATDHHHRWSPCLAARGHVCRSLVPCCRFTPQLYVMQIISATEDLHDSASPAMMEWWTRSLVTATKLGTPPAAAPRWRTTSAGA